MAVHIRLSRIGKKNAPFFRVVVVDSRKKRDGAELANIGTYDVIHSAIVRFDEPLYNEWLSKGARPTDSAKKIYKQYKRVGIPVPAQKKEAVFVPEVAVTERNKEVILPESESASQE
ncbi:MAG TPA: 30S ribosomal protein S16 [Candidatus Bathyarchaeia archaeon]|nr:30S ribosomal protein S16 [Candidatus Bathyarchaeia archaeon]